MMTMQQFNEWLDMVYTTPLTEWEKTIARNAYLKACLDAKKQIEVFAEDFEVPRI
jgi:hypothetical protein